MYRFINVVAVIYRILIFYSILLFMLLFIIVTFTVQYRELGARIIRWNQRLFLQRSVTILSRKTWNFMKYSLYKSTYYFRRNFWKGKNMHFKHELIRHPKSTLILWRFFLCMIEMINTMEYLRGLANAAE